MHILINVYLSIRKILDFVVTYFFYLIFFYIKTILNILGCMFFP
jgi:hypothetical protein